MCFKRHPDGRWGLEPQRWPDGRSDYWRPLDEQEKPWLLRGKDHGTQVVLLGQHERHDTTHPPDGVADGRRQWITRYLNGRFVQLPEQVEVLVRVHHGRGQPRQHSASTARSTTSSIARSRPEPCTSATRSPTGGCSMTTIARDGAKPAISASVGHAAAVYVKDLYDTLPHTRGGHGRLQDLRGPQGIR